MISGKTGLYAGFMASSCFSTYSFKEVRHTTNGSGIGLSRINIFQIKRSLLHLQALNFLIKIGKPLKIYFSAEW
jgi:hypothetical protein